jgi:hypothetical protein
MTIGVWDVVTALALLVVFLVLSRYVHSARLRDWAALPTVRTRRHLAEVEDQIALDAQVVEEAYGAATGSREQPDEAAHLLRCAFDLIQATQTDRIQRLKLMAQFARMSAAIMVAPPVRVARFKLREIRSLAAVGWVLHQFLVSPTERFLARLRVLAWGFWLALRSLRGARDRVSANPQVEASWGRFETALGDWRELDKEHAFAVRHLLMSLSAEPATAAHAPVKQP